MMLKKYARLTSCLQGLKCGRFLKRILGLDGSAMILKCRKFSGGGSDELEANMLFSGLDVKVVTSWCFLDGFISDQEIMWSRRC